MFNLGGDYVLWTDEDGRSVRSMLSNGSAAGTITSNVRFHVITVEAAGSYDGDTVPVVRVHVDDVPAGDIRLYSHDLEAYTVTGDWPAGEHTLTVEYVNDSGQDSAVFSSAEIGAAPGALVDLEPLLNRVGSQEKDYTDHPFSPTTFSNTRVGPAVEFAPDDDPRHATFREGSTDVASKRWSISVQHTDGGDPTATLQANGDKHFIKIPADAATTGGTDDHMVVIQPDGRTAYELWGMEKIAADEWKARYLVITDLQGDGMDGGARASGISQLHGLIRRNELRNLDIEHSLAIGISGSMLKSVNDGRGVWPARAEDANNSWAYTGTIPMGTMFAIPPSVDVDELDLTPEGRAVARALQQYGGHVLIQADNTNLYAEMAADEGQVANLEADWPQLRDLLRVVTNNSEDNIAGAH